jgi:peptidoglycan/LPS O-acetylase OafA/YrhL
LQQLHRQQATRLRSLGFPMLLLVSAAFAVVLLQHNGILHQPYKLETLMGFMIGLAFLVILGTKKQNRIDNFAGDISYGVFLNHFFIMWLLYPQGVAPSQLAGFLVFSIALSWLTQRYVERPLLKRRYSLRRNVKLTSISRTG